MRGAAGPAARAGAGAVAVPAAGHGRVVRGQGAAGRGAAGAARRLGEVMPMFPRMYRMKPQSLTSPLRLGGQPPNLSIGCQKRKALLLNVSHGKPKCYGLRISTSRLSQALKPMASAGKNWTRVQIQDPQQKKWRWGKKRHIQETWICHCPQVGSSRSALRTVVPGQLRKNPSSPVLQKERI